MSDDCNVNPEICNFNRVFMPYCDGKSSSSVEITTELMQTAGVGASFSGNRDEPVSVDGTNVGKHLLVAC
jgi:hypothetical protein